MENAEKNEVKSYITQGNNINKNESNEKNNIKEADKYEFVLYSDSNIKDDSESQGISKEEEEESLTLEEYYLECARSGELNDLKEAMKDADDKFDVNLKDPRGNTALHFAATNGHLEVVEYLINELKCDINVQNNIQNTPLIWAAFNGQRKVSEFLIEKGADVDIRNENNKKASEVAFDNGFYDLSELLISKETNNGNSSIKEEEVNIDETETEEEIKEK